jgi:hypothetical protein
MQRLFPEDHDTRVIGTDAAEWKTGNDSIAQFIKADWLEWGDVHLAVDDSSISSSANVAWLATTGREVSAHSSRAIRFTAVLIRRDGRWLFRQIQFQWDERPLSFSDLVSGNGSAHLKYR